MRVDCLRLPIPLRLDHLNAYLICGPGGHALVDTGLATSSCREALLGALKSRGLEPRQIGELFITHFHGDHWGQASWLQQQGLRLIMPRIDSRFLQRWFDHPAYEADAVAYFRGLGVAEEILGSSLRAMTRMRASLPRFIPDQEVEHGEVIALAGEPFEVIITPGHTPGHACLHHQASGTLLVGDHVLPHITPNITASHHGPQDPLTDYLGALRRLKGRGFAAVWPAHGQRILDLDRRIEEILLHHEERESLLLRHLEDGPRSLYHLAQQLFQLQELDGWETWMALGETLAHLRALESEGRLSTSREHDQLLFARS